MGQAAGFDWLPQAFPTRAFTLFTAYPLPKDGKEQARYCPEETGDRKTDGLPGKSAGGVCGQGSLLIPSSTQGRKNLGDLHFASQPPDPEPETGLPPPGPACPDDEEPGMISWISNQC